ncbi:MAG: Fe-Mn family superoxide dismutase [Waddliaceae bacterium]
MVQSKQKFELPTLKYDLNALEPVISGEIMDLHYNKHHKTYVEKLNAALEQLDEAIASENLPKQIQLQSAIKFNGGGHINHSLFWENLAPESEDGGVAPTGDLAKAIDETFGSLDQFISKFNDVTAPVQGSGWGWLGYNKEKKRIEIATCQNQDPLAVTGLVPLLGIDVWEHAYYLQYKNARPEYLKAIWKVINWKTVELRYAQAISK